MRSPGAWGRCLGALIAFLAVIGCALVSASAALADVMTQEGQPFSGQVLTLSPNACPMVAGTPKPMIDWGDGTPMSVGTVTTTGISGNHTYARFGTATGTVSYSCFNGNVNVPQTATFEATIADAPLTSTGATIAATAGRPFTMVVAHVADVNPGGVASDLTASVSWGDGTNDAAVVTPAAGGGFDVTGLHTYATAGTDTISTVVTSAGGSTTTATGTANVTVPPPVLPTASAPPTITGMVRQNETLTAAPGTWSGAPTGYLYQWLRCDAGGNGCSPITGATAAQYVPVAADLGLTLRVAVRAVNGAGTSLPVDSAATGPVAHATLRAQLTVGPNPTCPGYEVRLDGSSSVSGGPPIVRYVFTATVDVHFVAETTDPGTIPIATGSAPAVNATFSYDSGDLYGDPFLLLGMDPASHGTYFADNRIIRLTVIDSTGATSSTEQELDFNHPYSNRTDPDHPCPLRVAPSVTATINYHSLVFSVIHTGAAASLATRLPCVSVLDCAGSLTLTALRPDLVIPHPGSAAALRRPKTVVLGTTRFYVTGHHTRTATIKLTKAGRRAISGARRVPATVRLTTLNAKGHPSTHSVAVTLPRARRRTSPSFR